jgi:EmrB/QacA subfamily drug resistance transporter
VATTSTGAIGAPTGQIPDSWLTGRKLAMLLCCAGAPFMIMLDTNIVAVALPAIARDLHGEFVDVEWVVSAYILPFASLLMPAGALADRLGRKKMLLLGLSIFTFASLLCGLAPNLLVLNLARALQAVGGALQLSSSLSVIAHGFDAKHRARVYAIWATVMGVAPSLGPLLGGFLTSYLGWRWAFYINLPIGALLIATVVASVDESRDPKAVSLDVRGILLFGVGFFCIVWALIEANRVGWGSQSTALKLVLGAVFLGAFAFAETLHPRPMIDLSVFKNPTVVGAVTSMIGYAAAGQVMMTLLPIYLQDAFGQSPAGAGVSMIAFALPMLAGPTIGGRLSARYSSRVMLTFGLLAIGLGDAIVAAMAFAGFGYWSVAGGMAIIGVAVGVLNSETTKAQVSSIPPERAGMASGLAGTTRFIGISFGLAGLGAILAAVAESRLRQLSSGAVLSQNVDWHDLNLRVVGGDAQGALSAFVGDVRAVLEHAVDGSVALGFGATFATGTVIALVSAALAWILVRTPAVSSSAQSKDANQPNDEPGKAEVLAAAE